MRILIIDDEEVLQDVLSSLLAQEGYETLSARSGEEGLTLMRREAVDLVLLDLMLPTMSGLEVLRQITHEDPEQIVIVITAYSSVESAIEAMKGGAFHYIPKPFKNEEVLLTIRRGLEQRRLRTENRTLKRKLAGSFSMDQIVGKSDAMQQIFELIRRAAPARSNILIRGESGTGKELVAKAIHQHSRRADGPFVTVNSGSMPPDLLESNLFGHVKGAFTGAIANKKGLFEVADGGTLFLDEIGNIPLDTQAKLLRVIQEKEFMPVGSVEVKRAEVRFVAATNAELERAVVDGRLREDLYYRLNVITVELPPLRDRAEDIPLLVRHFLKVYAAENDKPVTDVTPAAMELLLDYSWPGNVRELENVIERAVVLSSGEILDVELLSPAVRRHEAPAFELDEMPSAELPLKEAVSRYERRLIERALKATGGVQKRAAELLQVKPTTLHEMIKRLNISIDSVTTTH